MKKLKTELNVDVIGGLGPLTKEEEKQISEYIKRKSLKKGPRAAGTRSPKPAALV